MKKVLVLLTMLMAFSLAIFANSYEELTKDFVRGDAGIQSMSVLTFSPEGILFVGDSKAGKIIAIDLEDRKKRATNEAFGLEDIESKLASLLGTDADGVMIHDMAVNPVSQNVYLAVSRGDATALGFWKLANDVNYASILLRVTPEGKIEEVNVKNINHSSVGVPKVVDTGKENWRKADFRTEAITDIAYADGKLYVAGLSNEEFASALRILNFPFKETKASYSTIEVFHVAHGKSETEAPIRTMLPYKVDGNDVLLAAYTCTPFVSIPVASLKNGEHVVSKTLAEFGFGNMPIDMVRYKKNGKDIIMMSNTSKALIRINAEDIPKQKEGLTKPLNPGEYAVGLPHNVWSVVGVSQLDNLNEEHLMVLQRMPNGHLNLRALPHRWL